MSAIENLDQLRRLYKPAGERALKKEITSLDEHCRRFIALSPFVVMATSDSQGHLDTSPRGGDPGFAKVFGANTVVMPDWPGNNRLDSFTNIIETARASLIFLIPGITETLRINGRARLLVDDSRMSDFVERGKLPKILIEVTVEKAFLHCAKAVMRSHLWDASRHIERSALPTMAAMLKDHTGLSGEDETTEDMLERYQQTLY